MNSQLLQRLLHHMANITLWLDEGNEPHLIGDEASTLRTNNNLTVIAARYLNQFHGYVIYVGELRTRIAPKLF